MNEIATNSSSKVHLTSARWNGEEPAGHDNPQFDHDGKPVSLAETGNHYADPPASQRVSAPFCGMGKDELLHYSSRPLWRRLRLFCVGLVLVTWAALIVSVIVIVVVYPRCRQKPHRSWWQKGIVYRIYVPTFKDSNSDCKGDIRGIQERLDYLNDLGVNTISISPIYESVQESDFDLINHTNVGIDHGTINDIKDLVAAAHAQNMYILLDFIPGLTSTQHAWFRESEAKNNSYKSFYVWTEGKVTPNNWVSLYDQSAWNKSETRNEFYLCQVLPELPDLNLRNPLVRQELENILKYWLDVGVDGFFIRHLGLLFEDYSLRDEFPAKPAVTNDSSKYDYYSHGYTYGLPEIYDMLARWRTLLDGYGNATDKYRFMMADVNGDVSQLMKYYGYFLRDGLDFPLNMNLLKLDDGSCNGKCIKANVDQWISQVPGNRWLNWMIGGDSWSRLFSRANNSFAGVLTTLAFLLPGTPVIYYGDEISMVDSPNLNVVPWSRKLKMRSTMQWDNSTSGGFSNISCDNMDWVTNNYTNNVETQKKNASSVWKLVQRLAKLRKEDAFSIGEFYYAVQNERVFSFVREFDGVNGFLVAINFGNEITNDDYHSSYKNIQDLAKVELSTDKSFELGSKVSTSNLQLHPHQAVVLSWEYAIKEF